MSEIDAKKIELLPCPFCGGAAQAEHFEGKLGRWRWSIGCNDHKPEADDGGEPVAECYGFQSMTSFATKTEAIAAWNRRASLPNEGDGSLAMKPEEIAALKELLAKATPGPWAVEYGHEKQDGQMYWQVHDGQDAIANNQFCYARNSDQNAALIVAAINALPSLIAIAEREAGARGEVAFLPPAGDVDGLCKALLSYQQADADGVMVTVSRQACDEAAALIRSLAGRVEAEKRGQFQARVKPWMDACFGPAISADRTERNHRFIEESLELVQANGCSRSEAHQLVDYVYDRPEGELHQEIGGVMVTLAALCLASDEDMHKAGETELARVWTKVEQIRAKQAAKPKHSPLPQSVESPTVRAETADARVARLEEALGEAKEALRLWKQADTLKDELTEAVQKYIDDGWGDAPSGNHINSLRARAETAYAEASRARTALKEPEHG